MNLRYSRFYSMSDSRGSAPFDQYENHRDHTTTPLSITCSQWVAGADPRTSMRITDTDWLRYRSHATQA